MPSSKMWIFFMNLDIPFIYLNLIQVHGFNALKNIPTIIANQYPYQNLV